MQGREEGIPSGENSPSKGTFMRFYRYTRDGVAKRQGH